jgi:hypothetical protein
MSKHVHHPEKKKGFPIFKLALGAALAAGAGYYAAHKEEVDQEAKKRVDQLARIFKEQKPIVERKVKKAWGKVNKEAISVYMDVRGQILHALEKENVEKQGKLLKSNYDKIVADIISRAGKSGVIKASAQKNLLELFSLDWDRTQKILANLFKTRAVKKHVKAAAKAAKEHVKAAVTKKVTAKKPVVKKAAAPKKSAVKKAKRK